MKISPLVLLLVALPGCGSRTTPAKPTAITAQLELGDPVVNSVGMVLVPIPAGEFQIGSSVSAEEAVKRFDDVPENLRERLLQLLESEKPQHLVKITKPFYLSVFEVTQQQYEKVTGDRPWQGKDNVHVGPNFPATHVTWHDAVEFCRKLSEQEGVECRLPTEAQWEYACRAGTTTRYSFGDDESRLDQHAWYDKNTWEIDETYAHRVGQKLPNPWGLYDMHGNVWEWCSDWYGAYETDDVADPNGPAFGDRRVLRGGSWSFNAVNCRCSSRYDFSGPDDRFDDVGFRVARTYP